MKKIIYLISIILSLTIYNISFSSNIDVERYDVSKVIFKVSCIDGYKFIVVQERVGDGISITQAFEEKDGKSLPAKCWWKSF